MVSNATVQTEDGPGIRYIFYLTAGWLLATVIAVALLMLVVPSLI